MSYFFLGLGVLAMFGIKAQGIAGGLIYMVLVLFFFSAGIYFHVQGEG